MKRTLSITTSILLVAFVLALTRLFIGLQSTRGMAIHFFEAGPRGAYLWTRTAVLAVLMIVGMVLGHLHSRLANVPPDTRINIVKELKDALSRGAFWRSLLTSPIVFGITYWMSQSQPDPIVAGVLALENGFFCDVLFKRREGEMGAGNPPLPADGPSSSSAANDCAEVKKA